MKMKRKVQAQRKFAHGAPIPNSAGVPERRLCETIAHNKEEHPVKTVFHNKMSAVNLLDIVSLQNVHKHFQPKVLLERLVPSTAKKNEINAKDVNIIKPAPIISRSSIKIKRKFKKYRLGMCLRSKTKQIIKNKSVIKNKNVIKNLESHSTNLRKRKLVNKKINKKNKIAKKATSTEFSLDDDKPLKYFARNPKSSKIAERQFSKTRLGKQQEKENAVSKITQKDKIPPPTEEEVERRPQTLTSVVIHGSKTTSETDMRLHYSDDEISHVADVPENKSTAILDKDTDKNIIQSCGYYGTKEIVQWINNSIPTIEPVVDDGKVNFKVPKPPKLRVDERPVVMNKPEVSDTRSETSCPSEYYTTVKEVVHASRQKTQKLCKEYCKKCNRVIKVRKLSNMFKNPTELESSKIDDIYEFDDQNDDAAGGVSEYRSSKCFCPEDKDPQKANPNDAEDSEPIYLDLLPPDSTQIIQITTEKVPNQETRMLRARLVCKSEGHHSDISLVEYEKILDKLFLNLKLPKTDENNATKTDDNNATKTDENNAKKTDENNATKTDENNVSSAVISENIANPVQTLCNDSKKDCATEVNKPSTSGLPKKNRRKFEHKNKKEVTSILKNPRPKLVDAPIFYPTSEEFTDPLSYIKQIMPVAAKFGLCKVVAPEGFNPKCTLSDEIKFAVTNQYIARLYSRWGPAAREMCAIRAYLAMQKVIFTRPPLVEGMEINLPKLYHIVQDNGGLNNVIEKKRWTRVAEQMRFTKGHNPEKKLDQVYVKYLLPYDTLSSLERQQMMSRVEKGWNKKNQKMIDRAQNPLQKQMRLLGDTDSSEDETEDESEVAGALSEAEDCVVPGRRMNLATFKKVAANVMHTQFPSPIPPLSSEVEEGYWRLVLVGTDHVCVNTASIDTGEEGYGFTKNQKDAYGKHPWNLKMLSHNGSNILRSLGPVLGVTVPTLHLGMVFSTSCWHRDPHGLPWIEYMHTGPGKIWYGIPNEQSGNFRRAVETLCPSYCQNKSIWLPSDIAMIPPSLLMEHNVSLSRVVQNPREFIIVIPKAYSCSISTGYTVSESVYFATSSWLTTVHQVFQEVRDSCEPTMFSLEQLLMAAAKDQRVSLTVLHQVNSVLTTVIRDELNNRRALENMGVQSKPVTKKRPAGSWNVREQDECEFCRTTLYLSKVTGITGKKSSMCLHHALRLLETPKHRDRDHSKLDLITFYTQVELQDIIDGVQKRLSSSS